MPPAHCRYCNKPFRRKSNESLCSQNCRDARTYELSIKRRNRVIRKQRDFEENVKYKPVHDISKLKVGQRVVFGFRTGVIIGIAPIGSTIRDTWNKIKKIHYALDGAEYREPSDTILATVRYIVLVEKTGTPVVVWPYLWNVKGLAYEEGEEETRDQEAEETQTRKTGKTG